VGAKGWLLIETLLVPLTNALAWPVVTAGASLANPRGCE